MTTVAKMKAKFEKHYGKDRVFLGREGRWGFHTLGCTISWAGRTRASAEKKMAKWDADSAYWEDYWAKPENAAKNEARMKPKNPGVSTKKSSK